MSVRIRHAFLAAVLCGGWGLVVHAADEPIPPKADPAAATDEPGASQSAVDLLGSPTVLQELQLSDEQRQKVRNLIQDARNDVREIMAKASTQPQGPIDMGVMRERADRVFQDYRRKIEDILTPSQARRLRELEVRVRGMKAVLDPEIAGELKLTEAQSTRIKAMIADARNARHNTIVGTRRQGRVGRLERRAQLKQIRTDLDLAIRSTLSAEQIKLFDSHQGPTFDTEAAIKAAPPTVDLGEAEGEGGSSDAPKPGPGSDK